MGRPTRENLEVDALHPDGAGLAHSSLGPTRVYGALPGDVVTALFVSTPGRPPKAIVERVITASRDRREPPCSIAGHCGACPWMILTEGAQAEWKTEVARTALAGLAEVQSIHPAPHALQYRNRAVLPVERHRGRIRIGYYRPRSHEVVDVDWCSALAPPLQNAYGTVREVVAELRPAPYDERWGHGVLRRVALRAGVRTGEVLVTIVSPKERGTEELFGGLRRALGDSVSLALNIQPSTGNAVFGAETRVVAGPGAVRETIRGREVRLGTTTFFQLNTEVAEALFARVAELAGDLSGARVADLYAGIGLIGLDLADAGASEVLVVESSPVAILEARRLAANHPAVQFSEGDVATLLPGLGALDLVVTDPPRKGLGAETLAALLKSPPSRILHIACSLEALATDLRALTEGPYRLERPVELFDMLPQTPHVEALAVLVRR